jgi:hypothetical protein
MSTKQPVWKCIANLGDVNYLEYGGRLVFIDETGVYPPEVEVIQEPCDGDAHFTVHRFIVEPCTYVAGILSDNRFHPTMPAWFADDLESMARYAGRTVADLIAMFLSDKVEERAEAWLIVGDYHGFDNLDSYPLRLTRKEATRRYRRLEIASHGE